MFNLCALPVLVGLAGAGLLHLADPWLATVAFLMWVLVGGAGGNKQRFLHTSQRQAENRSQGRLRC